ncbi:unnamed protein product [Brassicogethes aeneus]|uniref:Uncharacterized protein n=1 Tax=Brassicogethes aeneus TaxID=1431903 RepID=A0A9P0AYJ3_BRAAE|nr:unnamed protein product [Brassicogethes aeneus]
MGVVLNAREPLVKTSELVNWITHMKVKKMSFKRKNLFIEAVLSSALTRAEYELRVKQKQRRLKWQFLKSTLESREGHLAKDAWSHHEEIHSLDRFMSQLKDVKPIER